MTHWWEIDIPEQPGAVPRLRAVAYYGDDPLRERVDALLIAHEQEQSFLESNNSEPAATVELATCDLI